VKGENRISCYSGISEYTSIDLPLRDFIVIKHPNSLEKSSAFFEFLEVDVKDANVTVSFYMPPPKPKYFCKFIDLIPR
jgi:hypothetical protein